MNGKQVLQYLIAKRWKQTFINKQRNQLCCLCTMEYYLAVKRDEVPIQATVCMNPGSTMLKEGSQTQKVPFGKIPFI